MLHLPALWNASCREAPLQERPPWSAASCSATSSGPELGIQLSALLTSACTSALLPVPARTHTHMHTVHFVLLSSCVQRYTCMHAYTHTHTEAALFYIVHAHTHTCDALFQAQQCSVGCHVQAGVSERSHAEAAMGAAQLPQQQHHLAGFTSKDQLASPPCLPPRTQWTSLSKFLSFPENMKKWAKP